MNGLEDKIRLIRDLELNTVDAGPAWKQMIAHALGAGLTERDFQEKFHSTPSMLFTWRSTDHTPRPDRMEMIRTAIIDELSKRTEQPRRPSGPPILRIAE